MSSERQKRYADMESSVFRLQATDSSLQPLSGVRPDGSLQPVACSLKRPTNSQLFAGRTSRRQRDRTSLR